MMKPLKSSIPPPEKIISKLLPQGIKMPMILMAIIPIIPITRKPRRPERSLFVVHPRRAVAVNIAPVAKRALFKRSTPPGVDITMAIRGAIVTPDMKAKAAKRNLFKGTF